MPSTTVFNNKLTVIYRNPPEVHLECFVLFVLCAGKVCDVRSGIEVFDLQNNSGSQPNFSANIVFQAFLNIEFQGILEFRLKVYLCDYSIAEMKTQTGLKFNFINYSEK